MRDQDTLSAIARDIEQCDLGILLTSGKLRARYIAHRKACYAAIHQMNVDDGISELSDDELLAALLA